MGELIGSCVNIVRGRNDLLQDLRLSGEDRKRVSKILDPDTEKKYLNYTVAIFSVFSILAVLLCIQYIKIPQND